jgi:hypothetical protein
MSYSYSISYHPGNSVGQRSSITEYFNGATSMGPIFIENKGFTYGGGNTSYNNQHFYLECQLSSGLALLYRANREVVLGQVVYKKIGDPILSSA